MIDYLEASAQALHDQDIYPMEFTFKIGKPDQFGISQVECVYTSYPGHKEEYETALFNLGAEVLCKRKFNCV